MRSSDKLDKGPPIAPASHIQKALMERFIQLKRLISNMQVIEEMLSLGGVFSCSEHFRILTKTHPTIRIFARL